MGTTLNQPNGIPPTGFASERIPAVPNSPSSGQHNKSNDTMLAGAVSAHELEAMFLTEDETRQLFQELVGKWTHDTQNRSDVNSRLTHPAYHKILAMGEAALPFIMKELASGRGGRWLSALEAITLGRVNPVKTEHQGSPRDMCRDWLDWGVSRGYTGT